MTPLLALALISGTVTAAHDGDTFRIGRTSIRLAGIQAPDFTSAEPCRRHRAEYRCDDRAAVASRDYLRVLVMGRRVTCETVGTSYRRTVAWCSVGSPGNPVDLSCAQISAGFAVRWARYDPEDRLGRCGHG